MRVFVYGTLRKGQYNHHYISDTLVKFLGVYKTREKFYMIRNTGLSFPYLVSPSLLHLKEEPTYITGEVYEITKEGLERIDTLEGVPDHYIRDGIFAENETGFAQCFMYILNDTKYISVIQEDGGQNFEQITSGDWTQGDYSKH